MLTPTLIFCLATTVLPIQEPKRLDHMNLSIYPLLASGSIPQTSEYISLDEGLKNKTVVVTEVGAGRPTPIIRNRQSAGMMQQQVASQSDDVNRLLVTNRSGKKLLLLAGEMVVGGKQDRILEKDTLILPGKEAVDISVYCVEHGRWSPASHSVGGGGGFGGAPALVQPSIRGTAQNERNQGKVWTGVADSLEATQTPARTQAYRMNLENNKLKGSIESYVKAIEPLMPKDAVGAVVAVGGKLVWMDRFASPSLFRKYWPWLLASYAMEAQTTRSAKDTTQPGYAEALRYANDRDGKKTFEGVERVFKLTKTERSGDVLFEIEDMSRTPSLLLHACRQRK